MEESTCSGAELSFIGSAATEDPVNLSDPTGMCSVTTKSAGGLLDSIAQDVNIVSKTNYAYAAVHKAQQEFARGYRALSPGWQKVDCYVVLGGSGSVVVIISGGVGGPALSELLDIANVGGSSIGSQVVSCGLGALADIALNQGANVGETHSSYNAQMHQLFETLQTIFKWLTCLPTSGPY